MKNVINSIKQYVGSLHLDEFKRMILLMKERMGVYIFTIIFSGCIFAAQQIIIAYVNKNVVNSIIDRNYDLFEKAVILASIVLILACIINPLITYFYERSIRKTIIEVRMDMFKIIKKLPISYYEAHHSGDTVSRTTNDINVLSEAYGWQTKRVAASLLWGIGSIIATFLLDWRLSILMVLLGIFSTTVNLAFVRKMRSISNSLQDTMSLLTQHLTDFMAGFRVMKMFRIERIIADKYFKTNSEAADIYFERVRKNSQMFGITYLIDLTSVIGVVIFGTYLTAIKAIDLGTVMAIITLQSGVAFMFSYFGFFFTRLQVSLAGTERIFQLMDQKQEPQRYDIKGAKATDGMIVLEDVTFSYDQSEKVLKRVNLKILKGQMAALVGPSGGGKSTIMKILLGFYEPESGGISVNGKPMCEYTLGEMRSLMAYVPQDAYVFDGTIFENIRYGRLDATDEEVLDAAMKANAHEFIIQTSDGYKTRVGERGIKLSGGQRQRIAIARAILKDSPILLLDEATSSLDSESEMLVQSALSTLMKGRTVLVIAHRLSTIEHADLIYVIEDGQVAESGKHEELLSNTGIYHKLHFKQFQY